MIKKKVVFINFLISILSIFITLILLEVFLRWDDYYKPYTNPYSLKINNISYNLFLDEKKLIKSQKKIVLFGDSFIQGEFCAFEKKTLSDYMEKQTENVDVFNFGINGKTVINYLDIVDKISIKENDIFLVFLYDNDIALSKEVCDLAIIKNKKYNLPLPPSCPLISKMKKNEKSSNTVFKRINNKIRHLKVVALTKDAFVNIPSLRKFFFRTEYNKLWTDFESEENTYISKLIILLKNKIEKNGGKFYLTYFPNVTSITEENSNQLMWKKYFSKINSGNDLVIFDPYDYLLENKTLSNMTRSLSNDHPSCDVYNILSSYYTKKLKL